MAELSKRLPVEADAPPDTTDFIVPFTHEAPAEWPFPEVRTILIGVVRISRPPLVTA
jgi:hypothetical protein